MEEMGSRFVAKAAITLALSQTREEEKRLKETLKKDNILAVAVDYGGEFNNCFKKVIEKAVVAAKREHVIKETHLEEGSIAGATHDALTQLIPRALGLNFGGKIAIARQNDHLTVAIFCGVGLLHLNDVAVALGHRVI